MAIKAGTLLADGWARLDDAISKETIERARESFAERYIRPELGESDPDRAQFDFPCAWVGDKRHMITVRIEGAFADPDLYANPQVIALLKEAMGSNFILESYGVVLSMPGSKPQHVHRDGPGLFDHGIDSLLPTHAVTVVIPLIDMNALHGSTSVWPGTHRNLGMKSEDLDDLEPVVPFIPNGSIVLWDYRLFHSGNPNLSSTPRPILYVTYCRHWFTDRNNWKRLVSLNVSKEFLRTVPEDLKFLFRYTVPLP